MKALPFILLLISALSVSHTQAGQLDNLESESTKSKSRSSSSSSSSSNSNSSSGSDPISRAIVELTVNIFVELGKAVGYAMVYGGDSSLQREQRTSSKSATTEEVNIKKQQLEDKEISRTEYESFHDENDRNGLYKKDGDPILATIKLSSQWLTGPKDINAQLYKIEAGYGLFGISYTRNNLQENGDSLTLSNLLAHYRMSFGNNFSWDLALGRGKMNGNQKYDGTVFSMPIRARFHQDWHFEYQPTWSSYKGGSLSEHQFSFTYQYHYMGASLGYKTWSAGNTAVDGVFAGLQLSF